MSLTDYEALVQVREAWRGFLDSLAPKEEPFPGGRTIVTGRDAVPPCDPVALRDGVLTVVARQEYDESLIERDLRGASAELIEQAFAGAVTSFTVVGRDGGVKVMGDELVRLGLQVQRLTQLVRGKH